MAADSFYRIFRILEIAGSIKASQGSCIESSIEAVKKLKNAGLEARVMNLPNQNHIVAECEGMIIDAAIDADYGTRTAIKVFTKEEHSALMKQAARKEPFNAYMTQDVVYKAVKIE